MLHHLRQLGLRAHVFDAAADVGGTWYWNRYPGCRCDVESLQYSYSFSEELQQEWCWSEKYATQPEILRYIQHVADRFDLRKDISFNTRINAAAWDEAGNRWTVATDRGAKIEADHLILATGGLSAVNKPDIRGFERFTGEVLFTAQWPHRQVDLRGKRVGQIGTGSSGIQAAPLLAKQAEHLYVFQRTANFSIPARNEAMDPRKERYFKENYPALRAQQRVQSAGIIFESSDQSALDVGVQERQREYERRWLGGGANFMRAFNDLAVNKASNDTAADFVRAKIRATVKDPTVAETLIPQGYAIGTKRICIDDGYFETFNRDNVTLVDIRKQPIEEITPTGVCTTAGEYRLDTLVFATGFDSGTGSFTSVDITGRAGVKLKDRWSAGPKTYLGLMSVGFPNLFLIVGPGSPSILTNVVASIEQHVEWVGGCLRYLRDNGLATIEPKREAERRWVDHVKEVADKTLYPQTNSSYMGANIAGKPRVFLPYIGGLGTYRQICDDIAAKGYEGFDLTVAAPSRGRATVSAAGGSRA
jgi:cyclohexanone monooxygenase